MQRIFNVDQWVVIEPGQVLQYPSPRPRLVRVEVNSSDGGNLYLINEDQEAFHLARICGRDTIEFVSPGPFSLSAADGAISVYTVDGTNVAHTVEAPQSFTRIVERRKRSPEVELIARMMNSNMERRLAQQAGELQAQFERRARELENRAAARASSESQPVPAPEQAGHDGDGEGAPEAGAGKRGRSPK